MFQFTTVVVVNLYDLKKKMQLVLLNYAQTLIKCEGKKETV